MLVAEAVVDTLENPLGQVGQVVAVLVLWVLLQPPLEQPTLVVAEVVAEQVEQVALE